MYSSTRPLAMMMEGFDDSMPRMWFWRSTHTSSEFMIASSSDGEFNRGFFAGVGDGGRGPNALGVRLHDIILHVSEASQGTQFTWNGLGFPDICTIHSVIASTPNTSTNASSVGYDVTVSQAGV
jgi:hypothetical protein